MNITKQISAINTSLLIDGNLVISDVHIGYEEAMNKNGYFIPRFQFADILQNIDSIFSKLVDVKLKKIIINGDLKHEFGKISDTEWRHTLQFIELLSNKCDELVLIKGNHDKILEPIAKRKNLVVKDYEIVKDVLIVHGDKIISDFDSLLKKNKIKTIIIGHEHPAVNLNDGARSEKFKCFLVGKWKGCTLIVMPSFTPVIEGTDVLSEESDFLSPFLKTGVLDFSVFAVGDEVYDFGKVRKLQK